MDKRVLIVDDDPAIRTVVCYLFSGKKNFEILEAADLSQAIEICDHTMIDLIICDYTLPDGNGGDLFRHLHQRLRRTVFLLFTGGQHLISVPRSCDIFYQAIYNKDLEHLRQVLKSLEEDQI